MEGSVLHSITATSPPPPVAYKVPFLLDSRLVGYNATCTECKAFKQWQLLEYASLR